MQNLHVKDEIIIVGARGMGRELAGYMNAEGYKIKGFLDDLSGQGEWTNQFPILGSPESWEPKGNERFIVALGDAKWRRYYVDLLMPKNAKFATFVSNQAYIGPNVQIGEGSIVSPTAVITADVVLGKHSILNVHTSISHDCIVGDFVTLSPGARITGCCIVMQDVFLGVNSSLLPRITIPQGVIVGAGSVVIKSCEENDSVLVGVPAKIKVN